MAAAERLIDCAWECLRRRARAGERRFEDLSSGEQFAEVEKGAAHMDEYGFKLTEPNLSFEAAFELQKEERIWKGKRHGPYKDFKEFVEALRADGLVFSRTKADRATWFKTGVSTEVEETTEKAVEALFTKIREDRLEGDRKRKAKKPAKN
jgi:hypothetical protein